MFESRWAAEFESCNENRLTSEIWDEKRPLHEGPSKKKIVFNGCRFSAFLCAEWSVLDQTDETRPLSRGAVTKLTLRADLLVESGERAKIPPLGDQY